MSDFPGPPQKFDDLLSEIVDALSLRGQVIIEGCLVEAALEQIGKSVDFRIYVMRTNRLLSGADVEWVQQHDALYGDKVANELIAGLEDTARRWAQMPTKLGGGGSGKLPSLERELIRYHAEKRPHDRADLIVKIVHRS